MTADRLPLLALTLGDPAGIGPEIVLAALADAELPKHARVLAIGPAALRPAAIPEVHGPDDLGELGDQPSAWLASPTFGAWEVGRDNESSGRAALAALKIGATLAAAGQVDALVTAPVSKRAMHLGGEEVEGQTELLSRWAECEEVQMLSVAGNLRVLLLTRHMPLKQALERIAIEPVVEHLALLDRTLRRLGIPEPQLALAGLNPHAGEQGLLGGEEGAILEPAAERARGLGLRVAGPLSPDSVFLAAHRGRFDGVLALYHDQAFIPLKMVGSENGVTVLAGLPYLRVSPVHGTAYDIAGKGLADPGNLLAALRQAAHWAPAWSKKDA